MSHQTPYINNPLGVADYITEIDGVASPDVLCAALLHDTVEDTGTNHEELRDMFGSTIADIVMEVTDDKSLPKAERKKLQIGHAAYASYEPKLIKLAEKLYNLNDLLNETPKGWSPDLALGYFVWSYYVVKGIGGINACLDKVFNQVIKPDIDLDAILHDYYDNMNSNKSC